MYTSSISEFEKANQVIPGGVNSPVRSFKSLNNQPVFVKSASGSKITDIDQNQYIDYCLSWGVHILGHAPEAVLKEVEKALWNGTSFGMPTTGETTLAELLVSIFQSIEMARLVNSGTEAVMSAIRLARGYTGRNKIIKFDGCYHGHVDHLLVAAGSGVANLTNSSSKGVPESFTLHTLSLPFNNIEAVKKAFELHGKDIAAIIVEPVPANMGVVLPDDGFLEFLREITIQNNALLIFDEVITGFRPKIGGAQEYYNITPDLTTLGKIIGGGFPIGAYGGKKEIMEHVAPIGEVYQAGTLSGNPIAVAAGIQIIKTLSYPLFYKQLNQRASNFIHYLREITLKKGIITNSFHSMFTLFFSDKEIHNYADVQKCDTARFSKFYLKLLENGIYFAPSQFEANFISVTHTSEDLNKTLEIVNKVLKTI